MKVISVVSVLLLVAGAVSGNPLNQLKESRDSDDFLQQKRADIENYKSMGCYNFKELKKRGIFGKSAFKASSGRAVDQCIQIACENNYEIIGIQKIGRTIFCRKGNERRWKPNTVIPTLDPKKCKANVGSRKSIFVYRQNQATCNANNKSYNDGDTIIFHNTTYPIENALCTSCQCSAGDITDCDSYYCDIGWVGPPTEICDNWITGEEGVCCPRCACSNNGDTWIKHSSSGDCYECSCQDSTVVCSSAMFCATGCPGITVPVPGKCCSKCGPTTPHIFTILPTTTLPPPSFPFPFPFKRDMISLGDEAEQDDTEQSKPSD